MRLTMQSISRTAALLAILATTVASAVPDSAALIARVARRAPASVPFAEVRFSSLLIEPLVVRGTLEHEAGGGLLRRVESPYRESTSIRDETVRVERDGEPARTFALRRAPELRGFVTGMLGLLTGDSALIDEHFSVVAAGDDDRWRLDLEPLDDRLRQRLSNIIVAGAADEPRCFVIVDTEGGTSVMLLGAAAALQLPSPIVLAEVLGRCAE
jgi:Outer membrane lipoprotein carrier protein LolA-like